MESNNFIKIDKKKLVENLSARKLNAEAKISKQLLKSAIVPEDELQVHLKKELTQDFANNIFNEYSEKIEVTEEELYEKHRLSLIVITEESLKALINEFKNEK